MRFLGDLEIAYRQRAPADLVVDIVAVQEASDLPEPDPEADIRRRAAAYLLQATRRTNEADKMEACAKAIRVKRAKEKP